MFIQESKHPSDITINHTKRLTTFLNNHIADDKIDLTHTKIGDRDANIFGGRFCIPQEDLEQFYELYNNHFDKKGKIHYLTEKQNNNVVAIDLDFKYGTNITERQHTNFMIMEFVELVANAIKDVCDIPPNTNIPYYITQREKCVVLKDKTKDGLHIVFGAKIDASAQQYIRDYCLAKDRMNKIFAELPLTNTYEKVFDEGVFKKTNNWLLYGSTKPGYKPYKLTDSGNVIYTSNTTDDMNISIKKNDKTMNSLDLIKKMSVQSNDGKVVLSVKPNILKKIENEKSKKQKKPKTIIDNGDYEYIYDINNKDDLEEAYNDEYEKLEPTLQKLATITLNLPPKYSDEYYYWIRVGWALFNTAKRLFLTWIKFSSEWNEFNYNDIDGYYEMWEKFENEEGLTQGTIRYWSKKETPEFYIETYKNDEEIMDITILQSLKSNMNEDELVEELKNMDDLHKIAKDKFRDDNSNWKICKIKEELKKMDAKHKTKKQDLKKKIHDFKLLKFKDTLNKKAKYFEKYHFKIMNPVCFGRIAYNHTHILKSKELTEIYENVKIQKPGAFALTPVKFTDEWRVMEKIKFYENVDFLPYPCECPSYTYNTFNGLVASKLKNNDENEDISIFLNHMRILTGKEEKSYEYLLNYLAHMVQKPGELVGTSLVFRSEQGVGKNVFFENFGKYILGSDNVLQTPEVDKVIGRFSMSNRKILIIMDEANGKDNFSSNDKLKNFITAETNLWERKGVDGITLKNFARLILFSNNNTPIKIEMSDRRFVVYECSNDYRNNIEYFKSLIKAFKNEKKIKALYDYLMNRPITEWDRVNDRPITKAYKDIQSVNIPIVARFLEYYICEYGTIEGDDEVVFTKENCKGRDLYALFNMWKQENGYIHNYNNTQFGRELKKYDGITKNKSNCIKYVFDMEKLKLFMIKHKYMEDEE